MKQIEEAYLTGERALFHGKDMEIKNCTFDDGESPLKESNHIRLWDSTFKWKYPLWYSKDIEAQRITLLETARSAIWYTKNITIKDSVIQAPKSFRRSANIDLSNVHFVNAEETLWNCEHITLEKITAQGDYFAMNSKNLTISDITLSGNYAFDGAKDVEIHHAKLLSKDAFWNCENVTVYDSVIIGEYLGWNSKNVRFVNCTIDSLQGMCYMDHVVLEHCTLLHTTRAFEYSTVQADIVSSIDSVTNPQGGRISANEIKEIILEETYIDPSKICIQTREMVA